MESQPCSRTGENSPYGMIGGIEQTSASSEARSAPRSYPTISDMKASARCCFEAHRGPPLTMVSIFITKAGHGDPHADRAGGSRLAIHRFISIVDPQANAKLIGSPYCFALISVVGISFYCSRGKEKDRRRSDGPMRYYPMTYTLVIRIFLPKRPGAAPSSIAEPLAHRISSS